jgi:hypothetical protein
MPRLGAVGGRVPNKRIGNVEAGETVRRVSEDQFTEVADGTSSSRGDRRKLERREVSAVVTRPLELQTRLASTIGALRTYDECKRRTRHARE